MIEILGGHGALPNECDRLRGQKVLIRPGATDKGEGKEVIIGNARKVDGNNKISCRKVVAEKTPDGGETLKVTVTNAGAIANR
jgi:hypothetical protein